jgi:hypothetical protein
MCTDLPLGPNYVWSVSGTGADIFEGHLASGGGSGGLSFPYLITPFNSLTDRAVKDNSMIWWIMNNSKCFALVPTIRKLTFYSLCFVGQWK